MAEQSARVIGFDFQDILVIVERALVFTQALLGISAIGHQLGKAAALESRGADGDRTGADNLGLGAVEVADPRKIAIWAFIDAPGRCFQRPWAERQRGLQFVNGACDVPGRLETEAQAAVHHGLLPVQRHRHVGRRAGGWQQLTDARYLQAGGGEQANRQIGGQTPGIRQPRGYRHLVRYDGFLAETTHELDAM